MFIRHLKKRNFTNKIKRAYILQLEPHDNFCFGRRSEHLL